MPKKTRKPKYIPAKIVCPKCGETIIGDMPVIAHSILGCKEKVKDNG